ncbi:hypothetical protein SDC9_158606 [bioreactor metagenome]|uniref:Uncharacterized protein n=1 Tax=bioreactor metagenome TaxID=1076179 RepID=A0A645FA94_9ZZZZ
MISTTHWLQYLYLILNSLTDLLDQEGFFAIHTLQFTFVGYYQHTAAFRAWGSYGSFPGGEIAIGIIGTTKEDAAFAGLALNDLAAIFGASHADLLQEGLGITAFGEVAATDKFAKAAPADDKLVSAFGAIAAYFF